MKYTLKNIAEICKANSRILENLPIRWLLTDSRSLSFPEESLFFALKTSRNDGHRYVSDLYKRGLRNFVVSDLSFSIQDFPDSNFLFVADTLKALHSLASEHRKNFDCPVMAITGSNGKTIVKEWLWQLLRRDLHITRSPRSYNSQIGVPLSIWQMNEETELGIFEAGISQPGEMEQLQQIILPTIGILTNLGGAHQENFTSMEEKANEKIKLFASCETIIYCKDQMLSDKVLKSNYPVNRLLGWSLEDASAPLYIRKSPENGLYANVTYYWNAQENAFSLPFNDDPSIENAMNCLAVLFLFAITKSCKRCI